MLEHSRELSVTYTEAALRDPMMPWIEEACKMFVNGCNTTQTESRGISRRMLTMDSSPTLENFMISANILL